MFHHSFLKRLPGLLVFYLALFFLSMPVLGTELYASDLWKSLYSGRYLALFGQFPHHSTFTFSPVVEQLSRNSFNWLGNFFFYHWHQSLGILGVQALRPLVGIGAVLFVHSQVNFRNNLPVLLGLVTFLYALQQKLTVRTSLFAVVFFSLVIWLWIRYETTENTTWLYLQAPVIVLWSNLHGSYLVGTVLLVLLIAGDISKKIRSAGTVFSKGILLRSFLVVMILVSGVTLVKPYPDPSLVNRLTGLNDTVHSVFLKEPADDQNQEPILSRSILDSIRKTMAPSTGMRSQEFDRPFNRLELLFVWLGLACIPLGLLPVIVGTYSVTSPYFYGFMGTVLLGVSFIRSTAYLPLFVLPFLFCSLSNRRLLPISTRWSTVGSLLFLSVWTGVVAATSLTGNSHRITGFRQQKLGFGTSEKFSGTVPQTLLEQYPNDRFYNTYSLGGFLIWKWWPNKKVFVDSKSSAYTPEFNRRRNSTPFPQFLRENDLRHAVVTQASRVNHEYFQPKSTWTSILQEGGMAAYVRTAPGTDD